MNKIKAGTWAVMVFGEYFKLGSQERLCCSESRKVRVIPKKENSENKSPEMRNKRDILRE